MGLNLRYPPLTIGARVIEFGEPLPTAAMSSDFGRLAAATVFRLDRG